MRYTLYNQDTSSAAFAVEGGVVTSFVPLRTALLPKQLVSSSADGFTLWVQQRAIDLNTALHRRLAFALMGSRDRLTLAIATHMFSISDTFTCFAEGEFIPRRRLCSPEEQEQVSDFILMSSDTSLRRAGIVTPNFSTDGSFPKTWRMENGTWWLYKLQGDEAVRSEAEISRALRRAGFDAAEYGEAGCMRIRSRNFVGEDEFFEPYDSFRYRFADKRDDENVVYRNLASLGSSFEAAWRRILLSDALFMNADRHMRNFGVIRSAVTGEVLRLAPNFDNNQAYRANPGGHYSDAMLYLFQDSFGFCEQDRNNLSRLAEACEQSAYLKDAADAARRYLSH